MKNIFLSSAWLYLGDVSMVALLIWGVCFTALMCARKIDLQLRMNFTTSQVRKFCAFQIIWLLAGLVLFKLIILQGGPGFDHTVGTGNHGSVQFSTAGEAIAAILTLVGLYRWLIFFTHHVSKAFNYDRD
jgi:hypothetical protein